MSESTRLLADPAEASRVFDLRDGDAGPMAIERMWERYAPYADADFRKRFNDAVHALAVNDVESPGRTKAYQRFLEAYWEMLLGFELLSRDLSVVPRAERREAGPDLLVRLGDLRVWFECVVPGAGDTVDAVPSFPTNGAVHDVPENQVKLRLLASFYNKARKLNEYLTDGIVSSSDAYVIAINSKAIWTVDFGPPPRIVRALFGLGFPAVNVDRQTGKMSDAFFQRVAKIPRTDAPGVMSTGFLMPEFAGVSGVLHTDADAWPISPDVPVPLYFVNNPLARVALRSSWPPGCSGCLSSITDGMVHQDYY